MPLGFQCRHPGGTAENHQLRRPCGTQPSIRPHPALKRRAIFKSPSGTKTRPPCGICGSNPSGIGPLLIRHWVGRQTTVAQIVNLLYRRLGVGRRWNPPNRVTLGETRRLPTCDTADCQSALRICRPLSVGHPADYSVSPLCRGFPNPQPRRIIRHPADFEVGDTAG